MSTPFNFKLGKKPAFHDPRTLQFAKYLKTEVLPPPPASVNYATIVSSWPMMANDRLGDCTCAGAGHLIQEWTTNAGSPFVPTDDQIITAYTGAITGYDPETGANDNGAVETDVLKYWQQTGIGGHKIGAFAALEPQNVNHIKDAINLFGGCYIGVSLPKTIQDQTTWTVPPGGPYGDGEPVLLGGHCVVPISYDARTIGFISWGAVYQMTWQFWSIYCDEAYAIISQDYFNGQQESISGFNLAQLTEDLQLVQN